MKTKSLWFKQKYVSDILCGKKIDTYRKTTEVFLVGQMLNFSVGPRPPFAKAIITKTEVIHKDYIDKDKLKTLVSLYGELDVYLRIVFSVLPEKITCISEGYETSSFS